MVSDKGTGDRFVVIYYKFIIVLWAVIARPTNIMENTECIRKVLVCQNRSCKKQGGDKVLAELRSHPVTGVEIEASSCLGQCGNGPMVLVLPEQIWYSNVNPEEVPAVVERHLKGGQPITAMLYHKFHH
mgnify:CR=1 FL=1